MSTNTTPAVASVSALTIDQFQSVLPKGVKFKVEQKFIDDVNAAITDEEVREHFRENMITYTSVLTEGRYRLDQYVNAVKYVSFKMLGGSNLIAYQRAFPDKYNDWIKAGKSGNEIASYVSAYHKSKLVMGIFGQAAIPTHILNAGVFQQAINIQAEIMSDPDVNARDRTAAANSLLTHLKAPEVKKIEMDVTTTQDESAILSLRNAVQDLAQQQQLSLTNGTASAKELAHSSLIQQEKVINP